MKFSNKAYDVLKWICTIVLPALGTLYFALSGIWGFPYAEQIVGTIVAVTTFLGVLLGISTASYNKQQLINSAPAEAVKHFEIGKEADDDGSK